jgi:hypothetical protein
MTMFEEFFAALIVEAFVVPSVEYNWAEKIARMLYRIMPKAYRRWYERRLRKMKEEKHRSAERAGVLLLRLRIDHKYVPREEDFL